MSAPTPAGKGSSVAGNSTLTVAHCLEAALCLSEAAFAEFHDATPFTNNNIVTADMTNTKLINRAFLCIAFRTAKPIALKLIQRHCA
jgi:hypothetical protein